MIRISTASISPVSSLGVCRLISPMTDRHLAAKFVRRPGLALADALHLGRVQRIHLGAALPMVLEAYPHRQGEKVGEAFLEHLLAGDLAADVADHPAQPGAQEFEFAPCP